MVKTNGMLPGADYFLSHVSLVFDDRKSQPISSGRRSTDTRSMAGRRGREERMERQQFAPNVTIWWRVSHYSSGCRTPAVALQRWRQGAAIQPENPRWTIHQVQSDLLAASSSLRSSSSLTSVNSRSVRNVNTVTVTATS